MAFQLTPPNGSSGRKPSRDGLLAGQRRRDRGHARALANRDDAFTAAATVAWADLISTRRFCTSDDLWARLDLTWVAVPARANAVGAIIRASARRGDVGLTGRYTKTRRAAGRSRLLAIWESSVWHG